MKKLLLFILICFYLSEMAYCQSKSIGWIEQNSGTSKLLFSVYCINKDTVIAVGSQGIILRTINGGNQWDSIYSGTNFDLITIKFINQSVGYAIGSNGTILKTINSGINWINVSFSNHLLFDLCFINADTGWVVGGGSGGGGTVPQGSQGIMLKTFNGGLDWIVDSSFDKVISSIFFNEIDTGYYCAQNTTHLAVICKTTDGGNTWSTVYTSSGDWYFSHIQFTSAKTGYINGYNEILKTDDWGLTWMSNLFSVYPQAIFSFQLMDSCNLYYLDGPDICIGEFCNHITSNCLSALDLRGLYFLDQNYGFVVGIYGRIFKWGYYDGINEKVKNDNIKISPNPFNDKITLTFTKEYLTKDNFNISIFNLLGKQVLEIDKTHDSHSSSIDLELPNYPQGIYFLVIKQKQKVLQTIKLIKI